MYLALLHEMERFVYGMKKKINVLLLTFEPEVPT